jgi:hypothetical protein
MIFRRQERFPIENTHDCFSPCLNGRFIRVRCDGLQRPFQATKRTGHVVVRTGQFDQNAMQGFEIQILFDE